MLMHDAATSWIDTVIVDVDDSFPVPSRAPTEDVDVQVMLDDGCWHREMTHRETPCDRQIVHPLDRRPTKYEGKLCEAGCWSKRELLEAKAANEVADEDRHTGDFERVELGPDGRAMPATLARVIDRQQRHTDRIQRRLLELKKNEPKDKP